MKISRYIKQLENYYKLYGDIEIVERFDKKYVSAMPFPSQYEKKDGIVDNADAQPKVGDVILIQGFEWDKEKSYEMDNLKEPLEFVKI